MTGIKLLPISEYAPPAYYNSASGFDFDLFTVIGMPFFIGLPNFIEIKQSTAKL